MSVVYVNLIFSVSTVKYWFYSYWGNYSEAQRLIEEIEALVVFKCFLDFLIASKWKAGKLQVLFICDSLGVNASVWAHAVWFTFSYSAEVIRYIRILVTCCLLRSHRRTAAHSLPQQAPVEFTTGKH